jgi:hypothetical protein
MLTANSLKFESIGTAGVGKGFSAFLNAMLAPLDP